MSQRPFIDTAEEWRCPSCGRVLFKGTLGEGSRIQVKCHDRRCGNIVNQRLVTVVTARSGATQ